MENRFQAFEFSITAVYETSSTKKSTLLGQPNHLFNDVIFQTINLSSRDESCRMLESSKGNYCFEFTSETNYFSYWQNTKNNKYKRQGRTGAFLFPPNISNNNFSRVN